MACQWSGRNTQAVSKKPCSVRRSWITWAKVANSDAESTRRRGNNRQVTKNQRSESTRRRSRDMRAIIIFRVGWTNHNSIPFENRGGRQTAPTSALPALPVKKVGVGVQVPLVTAPSPNGKLVMVSQREPEELLRARSVPSQSA